jgi:hypothetical protein
MRVCVACGREKVVIGYETAEQLNVEPAKYFVRVTKREKRASPHCPEQGVACAPLLPRIIQKSLASDQLIIETIVTGRCSFNRPRGLGGLPWRSLFTSQKSRQACRSDQEDPQTETEKLYQASSSLVVTSNPSRMFRPKTIVIGTSPASRPRPITTRPIRR